MRSRPRLQCVHERSEHPRHESVRGLDPSVAYRGATWGTDHVVAPIVDPVPGLLRNSKYRVFSDGWSTVDQANGSVSHDGGASWSSVGLLTQGFDGDKFQPCVAFVQSSRLRRLLPRRLHRGGVDEREGAGTVDRRRSICPGRLLGSLDVPRRLTNLPCRHGRADGFGRGRSRVTGRADDCCRPAAAANRLGGGLQLPVW